MADEDPLESFARQVSRDEACIDLGRAALAFAAVEYPGLDVEAYLRVLDRMADQLRPRIAHERAPRRLIGIVDELLFGELGFRGNALAYYDPRNSYLNEVLDRGLGIPITLATVMIELGRRVGLPFEGVAMPGHFLVRLAGREQIILIDAFNQGMIVTQEECEERLRAIYGASVRLHPGMLAPVGPRAMLFRMLNNLKGIYTRQRDAFRAVCTIDLMLVVEPAAVSEYRDRGMIHFHEGKLKQARADFEHYLEVAPDRSDAESIHGILDLIDRLETMRN